MTYRGLGLSCVFVLVGCSTGAPPDAGRDVDPRDAGFDMTPPQIIWERADQTCPRPDYHFRAPVPDVPPGTVLWTHSLSMREVPGHPRVFEPYSRPTIHPSGAVSIATDLPLTIVTWDRDGNPLDTPSAPEPMYPDFEDRPAGASFPYRRLMSRGFDDVIWTYTTESPPDYDRPSALTGPLPVTLATSEGLYFSNRGPGLYDVRCTADGRVLRVIRFVRDVALVTHGPNEVLAGGWAAPGWILSSDGHYLRVHRGIGSGIYRQGCGLFSDEGTRAHYVDEDGNEIQAFTSAENSAWMSTPDCGAYGGTGIRYDRHGNELWRVQNVIPQFGGGYPRPMTDGSLFFLLPPRRDTTDVGRVALVSMSGELLLDRSFTPADFNAPSGTLPTFSGWYEIAPNGVMYSVMSARGAFESGTLSAIFIDERLRPSGHFDIGTALFGGGMRNWAHTNAPLPDEVDAYYRYFATDQERAEAGFSYDAGVDGGPPDAGDAGPIDASPDAFARDARPDAREVGF